MSIEYMEGYQDAEEKYKAEIKELKRQLNEMRIEVESVHRMKPIGTYSTPQWDYESEVRRLTFEREDMRRQRNEAMDRAERMLIQVDAYKRLVDILDKDIIRLSRKKTKKSK